MIKRISTVAVGSAATLALIVGSALAAVTYDPETKSGFVGKGDVQLVYNWNDKQLQSNASSIDFRHISEEVYDVECKVTETLPDGTKQNGQPKTKKVHTRTVTDESTSIAYDTVTGSRTNNNSKVTGFRLNGPQGTPVAIGDVPAEGDDCEGQNSAGEDAPGQVSAVTLDETAGGESLEVLRKGSDGKMLVGSNVTIWTPPAPVEVV